MNKINIDICICTFRRPHITETLRSIAKLDVKPEWQLQVLVADNDETPSAQKLVEKTAEDLSLSVRYIHAPARNISIARNACLDASTASFVAFVDDDEFVSQGWLIALMEKMESSGCDTVLGPVQALYEPDCPPWISQGDFHSTRPFLNEKKIYTGSTTGNVLLRRTSPAIQSLRFRKEFGKSGGEDTLYFAAIQKAGGHIDFAPDALITENVPKSRASFTWLRKRKFRSGQTHGVLLLESRNGITGYMRMVLLATVKMIFCFGGAAINVARPDSMRYWLLRGVLHAGVLSRLFGKAEIEQYGKNEAAYP